MRRRGGEDAASGQLSVMAMEGGGNEDDDGCPCGERIRGERERESMTGGSLDYNEIYSLFHN
jgi:hypothetical protein